MIGIKLLIIFGISIVLINSFEQSWAQESTIADDFFSHKIFSEDSRVLVFLLFVVGVALYALFVWYFYKFISKRDMLPKFFYPISREQKVSKIKLGGFAIAYVAVFPAIIFTWFMVLSFFTFLISKEMPFEIAIFMSMTVIAVVRILSYYREESAQEVAKMIPYALLSFFLTSAVVFADPHFLSQKNLSLIPEKFIENLPDIVEALVVIMIFEFSFRTAFVIKRRLFPVAEIKLEKTIADDVEEITKVHFKKMEQKEKELEKTLDELKKKSDDSEKNQA